MSTERPEFAPPAPPGDIADVVWRAQPARRKFQHNYGRHLLFFLLTFATTTLTPAWMLISFGINPLPYVGTQMLVSGLQYSIPVLVFLSAHEFGHYFACRIYNVDATLPYYIPAPLPLTGTLGAVIRIREAFPSRRALFDIGVAGPIAGFVALVPLLVWALAHSEVVRMGTGLLNFGEPPLFNALEYVFFGHIPEGFTVGLHPVGMAAWWGMLATALNLLPFGQLDGGHIMYAALGRRSTFVSAATLAFIALLALRSTSWVVPAVMLATMALVFGFRHPRVLDEHQPLGGGRQAVAILALVIFLLCFMPVPIEIVQ